ncbi:hypothetical protein [Streptomyces sp. NPDC059783]|uniref:hypothetical protein n=1 Tax=Streptomyces sp. NPDC059783 TaxID=3346944 RepID=UPI003666D01A
MPFWRKKQPAELEPEHSYRPEYLQVQDVAAHPGTAGYVRIDHAPRGGLHGFVLSSTVASNIGRSPDGQPWITRNGTVTVTPDGSPWAYVDHVAGKGLTVYLPDQWGEYVTLLADSPSDRWVPAAPGEDPGELELRGISAEPDTKQ